MTDPLGFERDVRPLFREVDRDEMLWAFDLWDYSDVSKHAHAIVEQVSLGDMPCDEAWSPDQIALFQRWVSGGKPR